ncbi:MAG TPA: cyclase family protein [Chloroflexota bacterium]|jgi:kynurenine formamidase|nr:cyclase family protein [Chloroflexota bacterium]
MADGGPAGMSDAGAVNGLLAQLRARRIFDLGQTFEWGMPEWPNQPPFVLSLFRRHGDFERPGGFGAAIDVLSMCCHNGTHLDALGHISEHGRLHGGLPAEAVQRGTRGLSALGVDTVAPIVRRGLLLDLAGAMGVAELHPDRAIGAAELAAVAAGAGVRPAEGDCVLLRTGWGRHWPDPSRYLSSQTGVPGPDLEACRWLADQGVFLVGADTPTVEHFQPGAAAPPFQGHRHLIVERGIHLLENLNLEAPAAAGVRECLFVCLPLKLVGATGSPVRPIAIA